MIYIEKFIVENEYTLESFFNQISQTVEYNRSWPLFATGAHHLEEYYVEFCRDFISGKKRSKPSNCLRGSYESVERIIGKHLGMCGPVSLVASACTSGAYALFQAAAVSRVVGTPCVVACGAFISPGGLGEYWFKSLGAISPETGIPFDKNSKGFKPGKCQAFFIVNHKRTDRTVAVIEDMQFFSLTNESTDTGSVEAILNALFIGPIEEGICWWNAHSPGTPVGDGAEYEVFQRVVGNKNIPISSLKGQYGHSLAGSYLIEIGKGIESIQQGIIPANVGIKDPIVDDPRIITEPVYTTGKTFLKFNMGFGGKNVVSRVTVL
jgi:3-oxoacyl-(acyl-carrier-protein) synthase